MSRTRALTATVFAALALTACSARDAAPAPVPQAAVRSDNGVHLSTKEVGTLGYVVTDIGGFTLYRFDKDSAEPPRSECSGPCATAWPPALAEGGDVSSDGMDRALIGTFVRADGSTQLTLAGRPLYRFAKDVKPGDAKGQGVGGTWFAVAPDGAKAAGAEDDGY
ncbi:hypothetical protein [Actinokineospora sp. NBRC 105648]|uniref:hypothetical protein n=1 Tax=Actinokineospora sp. NBRC 105648 TaxID=3032206 RepID=UPI0024A0CC80|nr:hypothetical protein [Actinokineospora sp. NBRC 105648]GLZ36888.1 hypothetical protein Acsp05_05130 [Actinokineospora sp. NBRC 105648]